MSAPNFVGLCVAMDLVVGYGRVEQSGIEMADGVELETEKLELGSWTRLTGWNRRLRTEAEPTHCSRRP